MLKTHRWHQTLGARLLDSTLSEVPLGTTITDIVFPLGIQIGVSSTAFSGHWEIQREELRETWLIFILAVSCASTGGREGKKMVKESNTSQEEGGEKVGPYRSPLVPPRPSGCLQFMLTPVSF